LKPVSSSELKINISLKAIIAFQLIVLIIIGLSIFGLEISALRTIVCSAYLFFVPGVLILKVLKLNKLENLEILLFSVGLSIFIVMFVGFGINFLLPLIGINNPISLIPLTSSISAIVIILCAIFYIQNKGSKSAPISIRLHLTKYSLLLLFLPFLAISGAYLMNYYSYNGFIVLLLLIIGVLIVAMGFYGLKISSYYPLIIFVVSLSLLYHSSLISQYLWGWDIQNEYYLANLVIANHYWVSSLPYNTNAMLSIVMLGPICTIFTGLDLTSVFKIIYPLIYSLVPVGLFLFFRKIFSNEISFFSVIYFVATFTFFTDMLNLSRQMMAELFFVLLLFLIFNKQISKNKRNILLIIFSVSLIVSHYGLTYIFIMLITSSWLLLFLSDHLSIRKIKLVTARIYGHLHEQLPVYGATLESGTRGITSVLVIFSIIFTLAWYLYFSSSIPLTTGASIAILLAQSILTDFLNPQATQSLKILSSSNLPAYELTKYLNVISILFIVIGIVYVLRIKTFKIGKEYTILSLVALFIAVLGIILPYFASTLNTDRLYHIVQFVIAPFCIIGCIFFTKLIFSLVGKISRKDLSVKNPIKIVALFLSVFFIFNSGLVYKISGEITPTAALISLDSNFDYAKYNNMEVAGASWFFAHSNSTIWGDQYRWLLLAGFNWEHVQAFSSSTEVPKNSYIYLGTFNIEKDELLLLSPTGTYQYVSFNASILGENKIYDDGGSWILS